MELKNELRGRISEYVEKYPNAKYIAGKRPWEVKCDSITLCNSKRIERRGS
jgi:glutamate dehydrogenase (NADP+)